MNTTMARNNSAATNKKKTKFILHIICLHHQNYLESEAVAPVLHWQEPVWNSPGKTLPFTPSPGAEGNTSGMVSTWLLLHTEEHSKAKDHRITELSELERTHKDHQSVGNDVTFLTNVSLAVLINCKHAHLWSALVKFLFHRHLLDTLIIKSLKP